ncbi:MAG: glycosyltransferase [Patescibacteria group bacterium]|nr:glycosyltransferase [Patescibacteria group bacterium]MDE1988255.1 glycosyltransferase [Patescibacteria group bacterium]MDE2218292.1 glycosyltransferase [Patescibacteria group bacterium]
MQQSDLFFSIIIPVHNEERYIKANLLSIISLDYPVDKYETIIVENASNDRTYEMAKSFEKGNIIVIDSAKKGVSIAKNTGIEKMNKNSDWTIFLDCDTVLEKNFLKRLNEFMIENKHRNYAVGTTEVQPLPRSFKANLWFAFYNFGHRLTKTSYAIQIIKTSLLQHISFDENLSMGEDLKLIRDARRYGRFFYFPTKDISTSTRRFEHYGWFNLFFIWMFVAMLPRKLQRRFVYKVIR